MRHVDKKINHSAGVDGMQLSIAPGSVTLAVVIPITPDGPLALFIIVFMPFPLK